MMFPLCLILGDSTGVGTASALAAQGVRCEVHAREGAPSSETLRVYQGGVPADVALIALGSNDAGNPQLAANLLVLRRRVPAARVTWLAPYNGTASGVVTTIARAFGDTVLPLSAFTSRDGVHPASYRPIAGALGWFSMGALPPVARSSRPLPALAAPQTPYRQAVVLSF
jgi:hypothetical protein